MVGGATRVESNSSGKSGTPAFLLSSQVPNTQQGDETIYIRKEDGRLEELDGRKVSDKRGMCKKYASKLQAFVIIYC